MFGYVKVHTPSMRVREHELYRALYCGLCRSMGHCTGQLSRFTLSYDLVFLAAVRILATNEKIDVSHGRCMAHPFKKRAYVSRCSALDYAACVSSVLMKGKLDDNIADEGAVKRMCALLFSPAARAMVKRAKKHTDGLTCTAEDLTADKLVSLGALEKENCSSIDRTAEIFGELTGELFALGLTGTEKRLCYELGRAVGRFIYVCDAADDVLDDKKAGRYNPILALYGDFATVVKEKDTQTYLSKSVAQSILTSALLDLERGSTAVELLCDNADESLRDIAEAVRNILYIGMPEKLKSILRKRTDAENDNK